MCLRELGYTLGRANGKMPDFDFVGSEDFLDGSILIEFGARFIIIFFSLQYQFLESRSLHGLIAFVHALDEFFFIVSVCRYSRYLFSRIRS